MGSTFFKGSGHVVRWADCGIFLFYRLFLTFLKHLSSIPRMLRMPDRKRGCMQASFSFTAIPSLKFGPGCIGELGKRTAAFGGRVLLVTGSASLELSGHLRRILDDLRSHGLRADHCVVSGEPTPDLVDGAVDAFRDNEPEVVVAVGGGSVLDGGKAIAAMLREAGSVADYLEGVGTRTPSGRSLPMIAVPTTSGTGSEATKNAVISTVGNKGFKKSLRHDNYIPKLAIVDPLLCATAPSHLTSACGMDALTQLIESYVSTNASPLTDALAMDGMTRLIPALPDVCGAKADDAGCRGAVAYGAFLSGVTLAHAGLGVVHGVAGPMGGLVAVPHGVACANLLPAAVGATLDNLTSADALAPATVIAKFARIGRLFGACHDEPLSCCRHLVACLYRWLDELAIPRLGQFGLTPTHVDRLAQTAANKNNPLPLSNEQIRQMIQDRL
jgi:alcohol dehydrogenase class IV